MHGTLSVFNLFLRGGCRASQHNIKECKLCSNNDFYKHASHTLAEPRSQTVQLYQGDDFGLLSSLRLGMRNHMMT